MTSAAELSILTAQTKAFVDCDPETITILPRSSKEDDGAGGWRIVDGDPLDPIVVRLIPQSDKVPELKTLDGTREAPEFILMAIPGTDVQRYDRFEWRGQTWEITQIHDKPDYELKGDVYLYAGSN